MLLFSVVQLKSAHKYIDVAKFSDIIPFYLLSKEVNIRGHTILVVAHMAKLDSTIRNFNISFSTSDVKLLIGTYMAYKAESGPMGDFLAKTNFPELCVQDIRNCLIRDPGNEVIQVSYQFMNLLIEIQFYELCMPLPALREAVIRLSACLSIHLLHNSSSKVCLVMRTLVFIK